MFVHSFYDFFGRRFRPGRLKTFYSALGISSATAVLDVGGSGSIWRMASDLGLPVPRVTIVNLLPPHGGDRLLDWIVADATALPFRTRQFDIAFSNSVIEHISDAGMRSMFCAEIKRVAARHFVQTPDRSFPLDPHFMAPVQWFPKHLRAEVVRLSPWALVTNPSRERCVAMTQEISLLDHAEMQSLFPGSTIVQERVAGLSKSLIAIGPIKEGV